MKLTIKKIMMINTMHNLNLPEYLYFHHYIHVHNRLMGHTTNYFPPSYTLTSVYGKNFVHDLT